MHIQIDASDVESINLSFQLGRQMPGFQSVATGTNTFHTNALMAEMNLNFLSRVGLPRLTLTARFITRLLMNRIILKRSLKHQLPI